jgi:hypothetical protein
LKGLTLATKQHSTLTGADLHPTKIDAITGTELTLGSQTTYDGRYVKRSGSSITVASGGNTTGLTVYQNDTTNNPSGVLSG